MLYKWDEIKLRKKITYFWPDPFIIVKNFSSKFKMMDFFPFKFQPKRFEKCFLVVEYYYTLSQGGGGKPGQNNYDVDVNKFFIQSVTSWNDVFEGGKNDLIMKNWTVPYRGRGEEIIFSIFIESIKLGLICNDESKKNASSVILLSIITLPPQITFSYTLLYTINPSFQRGHFKETLDYKVFGLCN